jgi:hypothetical protein
MTYTVKETPSSWQSERADPTNTPICARLLNTKIIEAAVQCKNVYVGIA